MRANRIWIDRFLASTFVVSTFSYYGIAAFVLIASSRAESKDLQEIAKQRELLKQAKGQTDNSQKKKKKKRRSKDESSH